MNYRPIEVKNAEEALINQLANIRSVPEKDLKSIMARGSRTVRVAKVYLQLLIEDKAKLRKFFVEIPEYFLDLEIRAQAYWAAEKRLNALAPEKYNTRKAVYEECKSLKKKSVQVLMLVAADDESVQKVIQDARPGTGYVNCADNLAGLYPHLKLRQDDLVERRLMTAEEIRRIGTLPYILLGASIGANEKIDEAKLLKKQAWTYFLSAYKEVRRYLEFLYFHDPEDLKKYPRLAG